MQLFARESGSKGNSNLFKLLKVATSNVPRTGVSTKLKGPKLLKYQGNGRVAAAVSSFIPHSPDTLFRSPALWQLGFIGKRVATPKRVFSEALNSLISLRAGAGADGVCFHG